MTHPPSRIPRPPVRISTCPICGSLSQLGLATKSKVGSKQSCQPLRSSFGGHPRGPPSTSTTGYRPRSYSRSPRRRADELMSAPAAPAILRNFDGRTFNRINSSQQVLLTYRPYGNEAYIQGSPANEHLVSQISCGPMTAGRASTISCQVALKQISCFPVNRL